MRPRVCVNLRPSRPLRIMPFMPAVVMQVLLIFAAYVSGILADTAVADSPASVTCDPALHQYEGWVQRPWGSAGQDGGVCTRMFVRESLWSTEAAVPGHASAPTPRGNTKCQLWCLKGFEPERRFANSVARCGKRCRPCAAGTFKARSGRGHCVVQKACKVVKMNGSRTRDHVCDE